MSTPLITRGFTQGNQSYQNNYEYKLNVEYYGLLSYAVKLALCELSGNPAKIGQNMWSLKNKL